MNDKFSEIIDLLDKSSAPTNWFIWELLSSTEKFYTLGIVCVSAINISLPSFR